MPRAKYNGSLRPIVHVIGASIAYLDLGKGIYSVIDSSDAEDLGKFTWRAHWAKNTQSYYAVRSDHRKTSGRHEISVHGYLMGIIPRTHIDHKNGESLHNFRSNLRRSTLAESMQNRRRQKHNTSGYKGVCWHTTMKRWHARISSQGTRITLGFYETPEQAYAAYCEAAQRLHGDFARLS